MSRLFIALPVPKDIAQSLARTRAALPGARWLQQEDMHITLAFIGEISDHKADALARALDKITLPPIDLEINRLDGFGKGDKAHILWAGIDEDKTLGLFALQRRVVAACRKVGIDLDRRKYRPHITLARLKHTSAAALGDAIAETPTPNLPGWTADKIAIYESRLNPSGARYTRLLDLPFTPDADTPNSAPKP
jgi:2'-5' RNA ligase